MAIVAVISGESAAGIGFQARTPPANTIAATLAQLERLTTNGRDWEVPRAAVALLPVVKHQLRDLFEGVLTGLPAAAAPELEQRFRDAIVHAGGRFDDSPDGPPYSLYSVDVQRALGLVVMTTTLSVPCGSDSSVYVFERRRTRWQRVIDLESNGYKQINGARGSLDWKIGGGSGPGEWFLVAGDVNPWCSSNWQRLRWDVLQPGHDAGHPRVRLERLETIYLGVDEPFRITTNTTGFQVAWEGRYELNLDELSRQRIATYAISETSSTRVHPVALNPDHFVDEWTQALWKEASQWTAAPARASVRAGHDLLNNLPTGIYLPQIEPGRRCAQPGMWQVGLWLERVDPKRVRHEAPDHLFFLVAEHGTQFEVMSVGTASPPGCHAER